MTTLTFLLRYGWALMTGQKNRARGILAGRTRRLNRLCAAPLTANDVPHELSGVASVADQKSGGAA